MTEHINKTILLLVLSLALTLPVSVYPQQIPKGTDENIINLPSEMTIQDLIKVMSELSGETFILDKSIKGKKMTIVSPQGGFKRETAGKLFEIILDLNGFAIVDKDGLNKIIKKKNIKQESIPTEVGLAPEASSDRFITKIIQLQNINVGEVSKILKQLTSREGAMLSYPASNKLIIIDKVDNINRILDIIDNLDTEKKIEFIKIHNADAADVATKLLQIFSSSSRSGSGSKKSSRSSSKSKGSKRTGGVSISGQADLLGFRVITDERVNSLILIAYPDDLERIKDLITLLDVETDDVEHGIYVIRIKNADAEQIVGVLSGIIQSGGGGRAASSTQTSRSRTSKGSLDSKSSTSGRLSASKVTRDVGKVSPSSLSAISTGGEGIRITADPATNSVIVVGSRNDYKAIKAVIEQLDIRRKQVFVEAAILEVGLNDLTSFGLNFNLGASVNDDNLIFGGQQLPGVSSLLGASIDSEQAINTLGTLSGLFLGVIGEEVDIDGSGPIPPLPSFSALFQALSSVTDVNVLSTPSILTTDNEQAEITVADVIPFPTGSTVGTSGVTVSTIDRLPVGIRLAITPQISEGEFLNLNIVTEVSNITEAPQGLNTQVFGIATQTRTADSSIIVKDGQTIVIGGLVSDRERSAENKTPLLGDIPLVGNLFKQKQKLNQKLNLIILLTPRIVETDEDVQNILEEEQRRRMLLQERGLDILK